MQYPNSARDENGRLLVGAALGVTVDVLERAQKLVDAKVDVVVLDSAHGHSVNIANCVKKIKSTFPDLQVIAGNIATGEAAEFHLGLQMGQFLFVQMEGNDMVSFSHVDSLCAA